MKTKLILFGLLATLIFACSKENLKNGTGTAINLGNYEYEFDDDVPHFVYQMQGHLLDVTNAKAELGRVLFYDRNLSINNNTSCGSCHMQSKGFADGVALSEGFLGELTDRHSMALANEMGQHPYFWDGRAHVLSEQVMMPIANHIEMGIDDEEFLLGKIMGQPYYKQLFINAFGSDEVTVENTGEALASFVGSLVSYKTKFDDYNNGNAKLTALETEGLELFHQKYQCASCHGGMNFNQSWGFGGDAANIGLEADDSKTGLEGGFSKVPTLRNIAVTGPYMHDGRFETLDDVLDHYSHGIQETPNLDWRLRGMADENLDLNITAHEKKALIAFLNTLTDNELLTHPKYSDPFN